MNWKPLPLSTLAGAQLPPLLILASFTEDRYTIHLTDLTYIWCERLDRQAIIRRSRDENTSIDPSSGDQFPIFFEKIKLGLAGGKDTTCAFRVEADTGRPSLVLNVTVKLPGGLAPLEWPIRLSAAHQAIMTSHFVIPLMRAQQMRFVELEGLQGILKDKDHVIEKLLDKLNSLGTDLGQIFPQAATKLGRKGEWNGGRVKGMAGFNMDDWRQGLQLKSPGTANLIEEVFGLKGGTIKPLEGEIQATGNELDDWWEGKKGMTIDLATGNFANNKELGGKSEEGQLSKSQEPTRELSAKIDESTGEEDFQVQEMPVDLMSPSGEIPVDDGKDLGTPSQKIQTILPHSSPPPVVNKSKKKLGTAGGKQADGKAQQPGLNDDSTADEAPVPLRMVVAKPKKVLGKIGRKKQLPDPEPKLEPEVEQEPASDPVVGSTSTHRGPTPEPTAAKPKRRLGQIGGKKKKEATPVPEVKLELPNSAIESAHMKLETTSKNLKSFADSHQDVEGEDEARGRPMIKPEHTPTPTPIPRETSAERADMKREQLKRELEQKAKAPVKKKRKF